VRNPGWARARGDFQLAIVKDFERRNIDYSVIGNETAVSWDKRIKITVKNNIFRRINRKSIKQYQTPKLSHKHYRVI